MPIYLFARGTSQLLGAGFLDETVQAEKRLVPAPRPPIQDTPKVTALPLLNRNPFDSVTGPLSAAAVSLPVLQSSEPAVDPLEAPTCEKIRVTAVTEAPDPRLSLASVVDAGPKQAELVRVGDRLESGIVAYIGFNALDWSPSVLVENGASLCQTLLFDPDPKTKARSKKARKAKAKAKRKAKARRKKSRSRTLPKGIARGIEKVGPREFHVDRRAVDRILENQSRLMRSARIIPERKNGETLGIRLFGIRKKTLLSKLGCKNGDRLESINGFDMTSPETALKAYARLRTAEHLTVEISRRGQDMHLEYVIN